jgi:hypothetical protein
MKQSKYFEVSEFLPSACPPPYGGRFVGAFPELVNSVNNVLTWPRQLGQRHPDKMSEIENSIMYPFEERVDSKS